MGIGNYKEGKCNRCMHNSVELCDYLDDWVSEESCNKKNDYALYEEYDGRYGKHGFLEYDHENMKWRDGK